MKRMLVVMIVLFAFIGLFAQTMEECPDQKAVQGYVLALKSGYTGLRLNAIYQIAQLKSMNREVNYTECMKMLERLTKNDRNNLVKIHANLALVYLQDDSLCHRVKMVYKEEPAEFFQRVYAEMNVTKMAAN